MQKQAPTSMRTHIRAAKQSDAAAVSQLEKEIFAQDAWSLAMITAELAAPYRSYWVLESANAIVGYAGVLTIGTEADVQTIAVAQKNRGCGWGAKLLTRLGESAIDSGAKQIFLEVRKDNPQAIRLYERFGFEKIGVRPKYYQPDGVDALVMRAQLPFASERKQNA